MNGWLGIDLRDGSSALHIRSPYTFTASPSSYTDVIFGPASFNAGAERCACARQVLFDP
ncbi:MAG: hypothetical protein JRN32_02395 [Nitrososphaerota archaeon]|jgi:hypothetical protein|nr:hypothetical protein [Nitrososphaerota archaeon]MDG7045652.1 hypothetical protein [Nitrososphaerota archaeon]